MANEWLDLLEISGTYYWYSCSNRSMAGSSERLGGVTASAGAVRWRKLLETGVYGTIDEIAKAEKINSSYVSRLLRMTLLAPDIVESILDGRQPAELTLAVLMQPFALTWGDQAQALS